MSIPIRNEKQQKAQEMSSKCETNSNSKICSVKVWNPPHYNLPARMKRIRANGTIPRSHKIFSTETTKCDAILNGSSFIHAWNLNNPSLHLGLRVINAVFKTAEYKAMLSGS